MRLLELLLGRPLRSDEEAVERIGVLTAIPVLGLDALASASYGPEAALTVLLPLGATAGIGAICSAEPRLLPYTLPLCLRVLALLTIVNLRGVRESGLAFLLPTYLFVASLLFTFGLGAWKVVLAHGHPTPVVPPPRACGSSCGHSPAGVRR